MTASDTQSGPASDTAEEKKEKKKAASAGGSAQTDNETKAEADRQARLESIEAAEKNIRQLRKDKASKQELQLAEIELAQVRLSHSVEEHGYLSTETIRHTQQLCSLTVGNVGIVNQMSALMGQFDMMSRLFLKAPIDQIISNADLRSEKFQNLTGNLANTAGGAVGMAGNFGDFATSMVGRLVMGINGLVNEKGAGPLQKVGEKLCGAFTDLEARAEVQEKAKRVTGDVFDSLTKITGLTPDLDAKAEGFQRSSGPKIT